MRVVHTEKKGDKPTKSLVVVGYDTHFSNYTTSADGVHYNITTSKLKAVVEVATGAVQFLDAVTDELIGGEKSRSFAVSPNISTLYQATQTFTQTEDESLYGGGEFQNGLLNWKDTPVDVVQFNTEAAVPFFVSTKGYGVLWDAYSWTHVNEGLPISLRRDGNVTADTFTFKGTLTTKAAGNYQFLLSICPGGYGCPSDKIVNITLTGGREPITVQHWPGINGLPATIAGRATLASYTTYTITVDTQVEAPTLTYNAPNTGIFSIKSDVVSVIDYYFLYGGSIDGSIALYRDASGIAPLYTKKTYGFWQCRNRYHNQSELLENAAKYRSLQIPVDNIVQDWMYWGSLGWGPHWDPTTYPDPKGMVSQLHGMDINFMVSVWSKFDNTTSFYKDMLKAGHIIKDSLFYDPTSAAAREMYYGFSKTNHFDIGVDSLWMDATEPESFPHRGQQLAVGPADQYFNVYPLLTTTAVTDGLRRDFREAQGARVFTLTRASFAGQQRTGAAIWSGDTKSKFDTLRRQIYASVNYQLSGIPYWSQDIGGFFRPDDQYTNTTYHALLVRWFQFGAFTPIFRLHGTANTEPWNYGEDTMSLINSSAIAMRYRFLPYTYSGFHDVEVAGSTMQRAMVFDFHKDPATHSIGDQFMWGKSVLVAPIYTEGSPAQRDVYFPVGTSWVDFNTGVVVEGGKTHRVSAAMDVTPLYLLSGSVIVLGRVVQHTGESSDPLEVRIASGADATFTLYEDDGASATVDETATHTIAVPHTLITFSWDESTQTLTVSDRTGSFPGMLQDRKLHVYLVRPGHGVGIMPTTVPDHSFTYQGAKIELAF